MGAIDIVDYLDEKLGPHTGDGPEYVWFCPFCIDRVGDESDDPKLWVNEETSYSHCFRCEYGARSLKRLLKDMNGGRLGIRELAIIRKEVVREDDVPLQDAVKSILTHKSVDVKNIEDPLKPVALPKETIPLYQDMDNGALLLRAKGLRYARSRGLTDDLLEMFQVGYCPDGPYHTRLIFPIYQFGELVYFTNRFCGDSKRKTRNPDKAVGYYTKSCCLFNYDNVVGSKIVAIAEGPFSVIGHVKAGVPSVGILGKAISDRQIALLSSLANTGTKEFVVSLDSDATSRAVDTARMLMDYLPKVTILALDWGDPDDRSDEIPALMKGRITPDAGIGILIHKRFGR